MGQVTIEGLNVGTGAFSWDIIVDGNRIETLTSSHPRATIARDHDFNAYIQTNVGDRRDEYIVRCQSSSHKTVYINHSTHLGFKEVSMDAAEKIKNRGCLSSFLHWAKPFIFGIGILILLLLSFTQCGK